jgi:hypothetical protein
MTRPWCVDMTDTEWDVLTPEQQVATEKLWREDTERGRSAPMTHAERKAIKAEASWRVERSCFMAPSGTLSINSATIIFISWSTISASAAGLLIQSDMRNCHFCCKNWLPSSGARSAEPEFHRRKIELHARPQIREHLLAKKMQRWALIGRCPSAYPNISPARARRNFSRLFTKYPTLAARLSLDILSPYPTL